MLAQVTAKNIDDPFYGTQYKGTVQTLTIMNL